jgi:ribosomal protein S18
MQYSGTSSSTENQNIQEKKRIKKIPFSCLFCKDKKLVSQIQIYNISFLKTFLNSKAMIKKRNCRKHQRAVRKVIILARHLHLLPYVCY